VSIEINDAGPTDAELAECLLRTADDLDAMDLVETAARVRRAAMRLEELSRPDIPHGAPTLTINEHAHGDDAA
jgi:hypothetical protein